MEPSKEPITTRYTVYTYVDETFTHEGQHYAHFRGSRESIALGTEPLSITAGDRIKITYEKVANAQS